MPVTCKPAAPVHDIEAEIDALLSTGTPMAPKAKANALRKGKKAKPVMAKSLASAAGLTASDEALIAAFVAQDQRAIAAGEAPSSPPALHGSTSSHEEGYTSCTACSYSYCCWC
jgi:hypothetical protein